MPIVLGGGNPRAPHGFFGPPEFTSDRKFPVASIHKPEVHNVSQRRQRRTEHNHRIGLFTTFMVSTAAEHTNERLAEKAP